MVQKFKKVKNLKFSFSLEMMANNTATLPAVNNDLNEEVAMVSAAPVNNGTFCMKPKKLFKMKQI